jgi:hypothetical protein
VSRPAAGDGWLSDVTDRVPSRSTRPAAPSHLLRSLRPEGGDHGARGSRAALAGIVFTGLFAATVYLLRRSPPIAATDAELLGYFDSPGRRRASSIAALYVVPIAAIAFIWFVAAFRDRVVRAGGGEHTMLSTVHLMSATLFVAVSTARAIRSGLFPRWFGLLSFAVAAMLLLVGTTWRPVVFVVPAWVLASSCLVRSKR